MPFDLSEDQLVQTETELGAKLPREYKQAMLLDNGGEGSTDEDEWFFYPIKDTSSKKRLVRTCNHIMSETESCSEYGNFPENALAIAENGSGDQMVFLKKSGEYNEKPYKWFHESGGLEVLAESFSEIRKL